MKLLNTLLGLTASLAVQVRAKAVFAHFMVSKVTLLYLLNTSVPHGQNYLKLTPNRRLAMPIIILRRIGRRTSAWLKKHTSMLSRSTLPTI